MIDFEACESLSTKLKRKKAAAEKYSVRRFLGIQQSQGNAELDNAFWLAGLENPADGLTEVESDMAPPQRHFWIRAPSVRESSSPAITSNEGGGARSCLLRSGVAPPFTF